jgi:hypothetical protein
VPPELGGVLQAGRGFGFGFSEWFRLSGIGHRSPRSRHTTCQKLRRAVVAVALYLDLSLPSGVVCGHRDLLFDY